jgi:hypothetical protein
MNDHRDLQFYKYVKEDFIHIIQKLYNSLKTIPLR